MENLSSHLENFDNQLDQIVEPILVEKSFLENLEALKIGPEKLSEALISIGDAGYQLLSDGKSPSEEEEFFAYQVNYSWTNQAKAYLILWRDILFQYQKAYIIYKEGKVTESELQQLNDDSRNILETAANDLQNYVNRENELLAARRNGIKRQLRKWKIQSNPWPVYRDQMNKIPDQCERMAADYELLVSVADIFQEIRGLIHKMVEDCHLDTENSKNRIEHCIQTIIAEIKESEEKRLSKIISQLDEIESSLSNENYLNTFADSLDKKLESLPEKRSIPVSTQGGMVELLEINFRKRSQQWLESEILPLLYEIWELTDNFRNRTKMTVVNIRNRVVLLEAEIKEGRPLGMEMKEIALPLQVFVGIFDEISADFESLTSQINERIEDGFFLSKMYELEKPFLPVLEQSAVSQIRLNQTKIAEDVRHWVNRNIVALYRFKKNVELGANLSISEKVVRYIGNRQGDPENSSYNSIFLTKGYVGESFWVGRKDESRHVRNLIQNWGNGFRGSVMITGKRLSGKSLFGELVALRYFPKTTIRLSPGVPLEIWGRRMEGTHNLQVAMNFIRKYSQGNKMLIWIDDLELWWHPDTPLYENVRHLSKFIDQHASKHFFMVAMGNALCSHLKKSHEINNVFQAEINMDFMPLKDIEDAILIRHGATHKNLVSKDSEEITPREFKKKIRAIYRASGANIGEALNIWAHSTRKVNEDSIVNEFERKMGFPDLENPDAYLLLASIILQKRTNEYRLRRLFGPAFQDRYLDILRRLISVGILSRQPDEWLELDELIVNDLGQVMSNKKYLNYQK